jgi:predicted nucleic acid-binding protein
MLNASRCDSVARERHRTLDFIGLRAHATTVGLIQLCEELLNAGILKQDGLDRIKAAIISELTVSNVRISNQKSYDETIKRRIDAIFPSAAGVPPAEHVGPAEEFEDALEGYHGA